MKKPTAWVLTAEDDVSIQAVFYRIHFKMEDNMELLNLSEELKNNAYPGQALLISKEGKLRTSQINKPREKQACSFERIYFSSKPEIRLIN